MIKKFVVTLATISLFACGGATTEPPSGSSSSSSSSSSGSVKLPVDTGPTLYKNIAGTSIEAPESTCDTLLSTPESILTRNQIKYAIEDIFAPLVIPDLASLVKELPVTGRNSTLSELFVGDILNLSDAVADHISDNVDGLQLNCAGNSAKQRDCAAAFISKHVSRAIGRKVGQQEQEEMLVDLFDPENSFEDGLKQLVRATFLKGDFIYLSEEGTAGDNGIIVLSSYDKARKLANILWSSVPDDSLIEAVENNELDSESGFKEQVERMLADDKFTRSLDEFHQDWIHLHHREGSVESGLVEQSLMVNAAFRNGESLPDLFLTNRGFVNKELAEVYGVQKSQADDVFEEVSLSDRPGILTRVPLIVGTAEGQTSPTRRGEIISSAMLCDVVADAPPEIQDLFPTLPPANGRSTRQVVEETITGGTCFACHRLMDPFGFALEHFGSDGKYRQTELGNIAIDVSIDESTLGPMTGASGLAQAVASSPKIYSCYAGKWFEHAFLRVKSENSCLAETLSERFEATGGDLIALINDLVNSPAMHYRKIK